MVRVTALIVGLVGAAFLLQGCYEENRVFLVPAELVPMAQEDVVQMVRDGVPESEIIREIRESGTLFRLSANDVESLRVAGVPDGVIDYMLSTREGPPGTVKRQVVVKRPAVVVYEPWWDWDYAYVPGYYYPYHIGLGFSYGHFGRHGRYSSYGVHFGHWR